MLLSWAPLSLAHVLFVMWVCFASQTSVLCSAYLFSSFPLLHTFVCFPVYFASQTMILRIAVFPSPIWDFVRLSDLCTLCMVIFCFAFFALQVSGLRSAFTPFPVTWMIFFISLLSAILCFRKFCFSSSFCIVLFSLSSHYLANFVSCLIRPSFASQTKVVILSSPLCFSFWVLIWLYCFRFFFTNFT